MYIKQTRLHLALHDIPHNTVDTSHIAAIII